ncbi:Cytochrome c4 precursor [Sphingomonas jeddahensis]|uniref:Cytochrome c4 n=1 Tax=Sphingomonas jeddahensis TaxID=1915074 RepID=A0A1V2ET28_9SPHN|nr:Cytochrome c4 precursor [Sphingomonas jeddahensis]
MTTAETFRRRSLVCLPLLLISACGVADRTAADRFVETGQLVALSGGDAGASSACFSCHGMDGRGNGAGAPRLAGLDLGYMSAQLEGYASGRRKHPEMEWIAKRLTPANRQTVSAYYASLPYKPATETVATTGPGAALYQHGDASRGLQPCAVCHGRAGEGGGPGNPALGGQPAGYLSEQLDQWRKSERRNDPGNVMLEISRKLTPPEVAALGVYASGLPGGLPRRESPAASRAERRGDPRNDASAPPRRGAE